jgi:hypothetical protein
VKRHQVDDVTKYSWQSRCAAGCAGITRTHEELNAIALGEDDDEEEEEAAMIDGLPLEKAP